MICPYNGFKECDWEHCAARLLVKNPAHPHTGMKVCAIAYNGGTVPPRPMYFIGDSRREDDLK